MKVAVLFSGGKDSNYALYLASKHHEISCLITMKSSNSESYMFQSLGNDLTTLQSESLEIPLIKKETKGEKEKELEDLKDAISEAKDKYGIEGIVTGAIRSAYQSVRIQKICLDLDLWCINPLWQIDEEEFMRSLIEEKFEVIILGVFSYPLDESFVGKIIDEKMFEKLKEYSRKYKISIAGEGGEFESFVINGPNYKKGIEIKDYKIIREAENSIFMDKIVAKL